MKDIRKGRVCWNCQHSIFYKRTGSNYGRGRGWCVESAHGELDTHWRPPETFRQEVHSALEKKQMAHFASKFPRTVQEYVSIAEKYYGNRFKADKMLGDSLHNDWSGIQEDFRQMRWILDNWHDVDLISWQDVCSLHSWR